MLELDSGCFELDDFGCELDDFGVDSELLDAFVLLEEDSDLSDDETLIST